MAEKIAPAFKAVTLPFSILSTLTLSLPRDEERSVPFIMLRVVGRTGVLL